MSATKTVFAPDSSGLAGIVQRIRSGDQQAFGILYDRYAPLLFGMILKQTGDKSKSEELLQKTFIAIHAEICNSELSAAHILSRMLANARIFIAEILAGDNYVNQPVNQNKQPETAEKASLIDSLVFKGYSFERLVLESGISPEELKKKLKTEFKKLRDKRPND